MTAQQTTFDGMPVKDAHVSLSGKVYIDGDDELRNDEQVAFVVVGRLDGYNDRYQADKIGGALRVYNVAIEKSVHISASDAERFFAPPVSLIGQAHA